MTQAQVDQALATGDVMAALAAVDTLPEAARPRALLAVWQAAGHVRAVRALLAELPPEAHDEALAFLADPGLQDEPPELDYAALGALRDTLARQGRVRALARLHLALADKAPRPDWRWIHLDHARALAHMIGDARLEALLLGYEALRDADFGEDDDALERVAAALALAHEVGEPRAVALAERARALVEARQAAAPPDTAYPEETP